MTDITEMQQPPAADKHRGGNAILGLLRELALVPPIIALIVIGAYVDGNFLTLANLATILGASAALSLLVLGESLIIITGKFDLTLESNVGITPALGAMLVIPAASAGFGTEGPVALALSCTLLAGAIIGILNGFMIVKLKLNAFNVTLAMLIVLRGLHVGVTEGQTLWDMPSSFFWLATKTFLWMPISVWLALIVFICAGVFMRYHRTGRAIYAIGGNAEAARGGHPRRTDHNGRVHLRRDTGSSGGHHPYRLCRRDQRKPGPRYDLYRLCRCGHRGHLSGRW